jgi:hypothetical protein
MTGDVQDFRTAIGVLDDGLNDQANFGELAIFGASIAGETGRLIWAFVPATLACGPLTMVRNCWKTESGQTGSRLVGSWGSGVVISRTAMRFAKSAALVGAGKSQETSLAESGAMETTAGTAILGLSLEDVLLHAALTKRIPRMASFTEREVWATEAFM